MAFTALFAGIALMPFVDKGTINQAKLAPVSTLSLGEEVFIAANPSGVQCRIVAKTGGANSAVMVQPDDACASVHDGLETVRRWTSSASGQIELNDENGLTVAVFGPSDGFAYETVSPANILLTLEQQSF